MEKSTADRAAVLLRIHQHSVYTRTDRLLCGLLEFEWALGIVLALWRSPRTWSGAGSQIHPHVWAAIFLGGGILSGPIVLTLLRPGRALTRHTIAIGQMMMSGLLIHLGGGQIEMHFQIFGALAFIAFYRDWPVLVTASIVTTLDHLLRGIFIPESIYGVTYASLWLTAEHAAFVLFEDIFLIGSCIVGVREMRGIAQNQALLEQSYHDIEQKVEERTAQLRSAQDQLVKAARTAGKAEIATSVLHNVGNVLNSVNVSATIVADRLRQSELPGLGKVSELMTAHKADLGSFLTADNRGKLIPDFIADLTSCLNEEQSNMLNEVQNLSRGIDHIKQIVAAQQSMAKNSNVRVALEPAALIETALQMQPPGLEQEARLEKRIDPMPRLLLDEHKILQILINLISNARQAVMTGDMRSSRSREITVSAQLISIEGSTRLRYRVTDNGTGIAPENLTRIFSHGFTTRKDGHGYGLHSAANAAREMGGSLSAASDGLNKGATLTLDLPVIPVVIPAEEKAKCNL